MTRLKRSGVLAVFLAVLASAPTSVYGAARWWNPLAENPSSGGNGTWGQTSPSLWSTSNTTTVVGAYSTGTTAQQATFMNPHGGNYTVTVTGTVYISGTSTTPGSAGLYSAAVANRPYTYDGTGTIQLGADAWIHTNSGTSFQSGLTINTNGQDLTFSNGGAISSLISGTGTVTKGGGGTVALSNDSNSYTGATTLNQGTLAFSSIKNVGGGASALGAPTTLASGNITMGAGDFGGTMRYTGAGDSSTDRVFRLAGSTVGNTIEVFSTGNLTITTSNTAAPGAKTLTLQGSSTGVGQFTAPIANSSGTIAVTKDGTGTWILSGNNTYTGATTINGGTLLINGSTSASSSLSVGLSGLLSGNGTIGGATTVSGTLAPGNSPGVLTFNGSLALAGSTVLEIDGTTTRGTDFDGVNTGALMTYGGGLTLDFGATFSGNQTWDLFSIGGGETGNFTSVALTGNYSGSLTNNGSGVWELTDGGGNNWSFSQATGDLTFIAVPEPTTIALLGAGVATLGAHVARRRKVQGGRISRTSL